MSDLTIKDSDPNPSAAIAFQDAEGNATTPDDVPSWASSDVSVADLQVADDGLSATVVKTGKTGATAITVSSTRTSDGQTLTGMATLTVEPSEEATISLDLTPGDSSEPSTATSGADVNTLTTAQPDATGTTTTDAAATDTTATDTTTTDPSAAPEGEQPTDMGATS